MKENQKPYIVFIKGKHGRDEIYTFNTWQQRQEFIETIKNRAIEENPVLPMWKYSTKLKILKKEKKMKDELIITLKEYEKTFIELKQKRKIKKDELEEILQRSKELQDIFNKNFNSPELEIKLKEFEKTL